MADLRSNFESTLVTLRNQPFELRWSRYWSMVLEALEYAPESLEFLNRLIVDQEEHLATRDRRQTIAKLLGSEREQLRREADEAVMGLLQPFLNSEGSPAERAALASERRRIRAEIHPHAQRADGADAYETYVLVLDYATAFAAASASAFRTTAATAGPPRTVQPAPPANTMPQAASATHQPPQQYQPPPPRPAPQPEAHADNPRQRPESPIPPRAPQGHSARPQAEQRPRDPAAPQRPEHNRPRDPQTPGHRPPPPREAPPHHSHGNLQPVEQREARPIPLAMQKQRDGSRRGRFGLIIGCIAVIGLAAAGGAAYVYKPQWFDPSSWTSPANDEDPAKPEQDTTAEAEPETDPPPAPAKPAEVEVPSTALDRFYSAIIDTKADTCLPPAEIAKSNWTEISTFADCGKTQGVELMSTFRFMLSQAGGKWSEAGSWAAPAGDMRIQLESAWRHITQTRNRWTAQTNAAVKEYASSYFGFQSHGTTGWRFAAWRCRCNLKGEFIAGDTNNVKPRLFITPPALINTEDEARQAYTQVRNYFLGATAPGKPPAVEQAANASVLPYDMPGGLGMARPFQSEEDAKTAWEEVVALHSGIGFEVSELKWGGN